MVEKFKEVNWILVFGGVIGLIYLILLGYVYIDNMSGGAYKRYIYTDLNDNEGYSSYCFIDNNMFKKDTQRCSLQNGTDIIVKSFRLNEGE